MPRSIPFNIRWDKKTVSAMVRLFCKRAHGTGVPLCQECSALSEYALTRLDHCPLGSKKTTCAKCPIHCYRPIERDAMRRIMREAGPRMWSRHPWLTLWHSWQSLKGKPRWP